MVLKFFGFGSKKEAVEHFNEPIDFSAPLQRSQTTKTEAGTGSLTLKDLAEGKTTKKYCLDCGSEFSKVMYKGRQRYACKTCWRKNDCEGRPPANAAPTGHLAATGLWEAAKKDPRFRRNSTALDGYHHSDSMQVAGGPRRASIAQGEMLRRGSMSSVNLMPADLPSPLGSKPNLERRGSTGTVGTGSHAFDSEELGPRRLSDPRAMDMKAAEKLNINVAQKGGIGRRQSNAKPELKEDTIVLPPLSTPKDRQSSGQSGDATGSLPSGAPASGSRQNAKQDRPGGSKELTSLPQVGAPTLGRRGSMAMLPTAKDSKEPAGRLKRSNSVPHVVEDVRAASVLKKLSQNKMVMEAMKAIVMDIARHKLTHMELFHRLDANGDGELTRAEMQQGMRKLGVSLPAIELDAVLRAFDADGNGTIDPEEFTETLAAWMPLVEPLLKAEEAAERERKGLLAEKVVLAGGLEAGMRVRTLAKLPGQRDNDLKEEGVVMGPGLSPTTVRVKFDKTGELNLKPSLLVLVKAKS